MSASKTSAALRAAMATLAPMPIDRLRAQYEQAFERPAGKTKRDHLVRALAVRATGTASAPTAAAKPTKPPRTPRPTRARDPRLPKVGATLARVFKGKTYEVTVLHDGFHFAGKDWKSLTAIAKEITGYPAISGPVFWNLGKPATPAAEQPKPATPAPTKRKAGRPISKRKE